MGVESSGGRLRRPSGSFFTRGLAAIIGLSMNRLGQARGVSFFKAHLMPDHFCFRCSDVAPRGRRAGRFGLLALLILLVQVAPSAQPADPALAQEDKFHREATRALALGHFDEAERLAASRDAGDPSAVALRAQVAIAQGRYSEAEEQLTPVATANRESDAALQLGLLLLRLGRRGEAANFLTPVLNGASARRTLDLFRAGLAARALGEFRTANAYLRNASQIGAADPAVHTAWGQLFQEKYNHADAVQSFKEAIQLDDQWAPAHLGLGRSLVNENPPAARAAADQALKLNPVVRRRPSVHRGARARRR